MLNRTATWIFRAFVVMGFALTLSACGRMGYGKDKHDHGDKSEHVCPHGGGACCEGENAHGCCTMGEGSGAESQPAA
jgi:hypothetical protein